MTKFHGEKPYLCYKIDLNIIIVETFYSDDERKEFIQRNEDYKPIDSVLIKGLPNEAA